MSESKLQLPKTGVAGLIENLRYDVLSGFLVFLIALPLCLGIAIASGFPPIAGILTAVIGGLVTPFFSNSELTIKGPAAGMIAIVAGAIGEFSKATSPAEAYQLVLVVGVISGVIQILFGIFRSGILGEFFPLAAVHGLLASIGVIIASKQIHILLGVKPYAKEPLHLIAEIPHSLVNMSPWIAAVGGLGLVIMFGWPQVTKRLTFLKPIPSQALVLAMAIPLGIYLHLGDQPIFESKHGAAAEAKAHGKEVEEKGKTEEKPEDAKSDDNALLAIAKSWIGSEGSYKSADDDRVKSLSDEVPAEPDAKGKKKKSPRAAAEADIRKNILVPLPEDPTDAIVFPNYLGFPDLLKKNFLMVLQWIVMFSLVGTLESMLSAKAVDLLDPWKRKTNLNRDVLGIGIANTISAALGGLPMISEIVRSSANISNGARTRFANMFHGLFLLVCVLAAGPLLRMIPLTALAAMLIFTGYRLASPNEFIKTYKIGREQLVIFITTIIAVLATDLLVGIFVGIGMKFLIHFINGVPLGSLILPKLHVEVRPDNTVVVLVKESAVFSNWIFFKSKVVQVGVKDRKNVILDMSEARLIDHSVMEKLHELKEDFEAQGLHLEVVGLENHVKFSEHPDSARRK